MFEFLTAGSKIAPEPKARVPARLTWRDFPDFVREVDELFRVRGIHEENLKVLRVPSSDRRPTSQTQNLAFRPVSLRTPVVAPKSDTTLPGD